MFQLGARTHGSGSKQEDPPVFTRENGKNRSQNMVNLAGFELKYVLTHCIYKENNLSWTTSSQVRASQDRMPNPPL